VIWSLVDQFGYELASPEEAREALQLKGGDRVDF
jgi:hypothetical protein